MRTKTVAFSNATEALSQLGIPERLPKLREADVFIRRFILGGSHSVVTYPPLNSLQKFGVRDRMVHYFGETTGLYAHIAFCETQCTFCHYAVKPYRGQKHSSPDRVSAVNRYLDALKFEMKDWGLELSGDTSISSIYIGGGTPLVLETAQLLELLRAIRSEFDVLPDAEICIEGSPLTITAAGGLEKMQALKEAGVTRFSFGVQSFENDVLKYSARGYKRETAIRACELVASVFDNWNLDLIQSLYKGKPDEVWENIGVLREVRPPHLTWYHGRFANRPQGNWYKNELKKPNFEDEQATLLGRMLIWEEMAAMGYGQTDGNRFVRDTQFTDSFKKTRTSVSSNLLGLGASSYSHMDMRPYPRAVFVPEGVFFRNKANIGEYIEAVESRDAPIIGSALALGWAEYLAASYVVGLRTGRFETKDDEDAREFEPAASRHYLDLAERLRCLGLIEEFTVENRAGLRLSRLGQLFEDEVLSLFYSPAVQKLLQE